MSQPAFRTASRTLTMGHEAMLKIQQYISGQVSQNEFLALQRLKSKQLWLEKLGFVMVPRKLFWKILGKFVYEDSGKYTSIGTVFDGVFNPERYDEVYELLEDVESKATLDWLLKFRFAYAFLGNAAEIIFPNPANQEVAAKQPDIRKRGNRFTTNGFTIESTRYEMENTWIREQYLLAGKCEPVAGDTAISVGAYLGETSIWLAHKVGPAGRVYVFEPVKQFMKNLFRNIQRNQLSHIIRLENFGLWEKNTRIAFDPSFSGKHNHEGTIEVISLDCYVQSHQLKKVDFIKMDIEGAEFKALIGARNTIRQFAPKLAICVYHNPEDLYNISTYLKSLVPQYKLYLSHKNPWWAETVLFASI